MRFHRTSSLSTGTVLFLAMALVLLIACGRESAREPGLEWKNVPLEITGRVEKPGSAQLATSGFPFLTETPRRLLKVRWGARVGEPGANAVDGGLAADSGLILLDFGDEVSAYAVFQQLGANPDDFTEGFVIRGERAYFRRGQWVGTMPIEAWRGVTELVNGLSLPDVPMGTAYKVPREFASMLHQGRVEGSERILTGEFLGLAYPGRVYAVRLNCLGDTAWVFAAKLSSEEQARDFGFRVAKITNGVVDSSSGELSVLADSPGLSPLKLQFSGVGMVGVEGCFDDSLTNFWIKMQARGLKNLK